jgi:hypothetical protein
VVVTFNSPEASAAGTPNVQGFATSGNAIQLLIQTDANAQIIGWANAASTGTFNVAVAGWFDHRGK